jgi:hypothetical protein
LHLHWIWIERYERALGVWSRSSLSDSDSELATRAFHVRRLYVQIGAEIPPTFHPSKLGQIPPTRTSLNFSATRMGGNKQPLYLISGRTLNLYISWQSRKLTVRILSGTIAKGDSLWSRIVSVLRRVGKSWLGRGVKRRVAGKSVNWLGIGTLLSRHIKIILRSLESWLIAHVANLRSQARIDRHHATEIVTGWLPEIQLHMPIFKALYMAWRLWRPACRYSFLETALCRLT